MALPNPLLRLVAFIWGRGRTNALWLRLFKYAIAYTVAVVIALLPHFRTSSMFLLPMMTVFAHPGQRTGIMVEGMLMVLLGALLGLSWSVLGLYLAGLVESSNLPAAYTIRALFFLVCVLAHGYLRSWSPRLVFFVLFLVIAAVLALQAPTNATARLFITIYIPLLVGAAVVLIVNLAIFPEFSSSYLGSSTIETFSETIGALERASHWFITPGGDPQESRPQVNHLSPSPTNGRLSGLASSGNEKRTGRRHWRRLLLYCKSILQAKKPPNLSSQTLHSTKLSHLTAQKPRLWAKLAQCKAAQQEVNFEISVSPLPPSAMKDISTWYMKAIVQNVVTLIGACENKYVVVCSDNASELPAGEQEESRQHDLSGTSHAVDKSPKSKSTLYAKAGLGDGKVKKKRKRRQRDTTTVEQVKPIREIGTSSAQQLESILKHIRTSVQEFQGSITEVANLVTLCLAYCFDLPALPCGAMTPKGIRLEELDLRIDDFARSLTQFDFESTEGLKKATVDHQSYQSVDFVPGMETFLTSSFILALRDSAAQLLDILRHLRQLVEMRQLCGNRSKIWMPQYTGLRHWLGAFGPDDSAGFHLQLRSKKRQRGLKDEEAATNSFEASKISGDVTPSSPFKTVDGGSSQHRSTDSPQLRRKFASAQENRPQGVLRISKLGLLAKLREHVADILEWAQQSYNLDYALKLAVAVFLVTWPAFVTSLSGWYRAVRGFWAPLQLIMAFEVAIGTSVFGLIIRLCGVIFGSLMGFLAYEVGGGHRVALVVIMALGLIPSIYTQVATRYVKAGVVSIVTMTVVAFAALNGTEPAYAIFYKRLVAFLVGGLVAILVEVMITPVRARDRLVECLSVSVRQIQKMHEALAVGIDGPECPNARSQALLAHFNRARNKAQGTLTTAESFLPFCLSEPRLKGSFKPLAPIYGEIVYVLHQIIDRMGNVVQLRGVYGSSLLEDLHPKVFAYRRNVAASSTLILFSVNQALTTWLPLPQFIPSSRLALLRLINRVRDILLSEPQTEDVTAVTGPDQEMERLATKRKFLAWNAGTAGQMEIAEYLEELVELVKLLVGVNAFRSGMLERPTYGQYIGQTITESRRALDSQTHGAPWLRPHRPDDAPAVADEGPASTSLRRAVTLPHAPRGHGADPEASEDTIPPSLQRVGSRLMQSNSAVKRRAWTMRHHGAQTEAPSPYLSRSRVCVEKRV